MQYDCKYHGVVAVSSREGRLLGGNRTLAEAFSFKYGVLPDEFTRPRRRATFVGVGVELRSGDVGTPDEGLFIVAGTRAAGPAAKAGLRPLDRVLAIDGTPSAQLSLGEAARLLGAGGAGSEVTLSVSQNKGVEAIGGRTRSDIKLTRETLTVAPKKSGAGYDGPAGGLYSGSGSGPKPPPALFLAVQGMREGGRRSVLVTPDVGYDDSGNNEIPPDASFELEIEVLSVKTA